MSRVLREPTVQFSLAAASLFGVAWLFGSGGGDVVEIDREDIEWRVLQAEMAQGGPLGPELRRRVEEAYIDEQVLVREALALGLEDDERIDDILAQKMLHVLSGDVIQPTDTELEAYYEQNRSRYAPEPTVAVDEVVVAPDAPDPMELPPALRDGAPPEELVGGALLGHREMPSLTATDLAQLFNSETAALVLRAPEGIWVGPHVTMRGQHWIRVNDRTDATPAPLDAVRERVRLDWIAEREEERLAERVAELRARYTIRIVDSGGEDP